VSKHFLRVADCMRRYCKVDDFEFDVAEFANANLKRSLVVSFTLPQCCGRLSKTLSHRPMTVPTKHCFLTNPDILLPR
jgi:hypothetical protein